MSRAVQLLAPKRMVELEVDGQPVRVFEGSDDPRRLPADRDRHPDALLRRDARARRTSAASASSRSRARACSRLPARARPRTGMKVQHRLRARAPLAPARARVPRVVRRPVDDARGARPTWSATSAAPERYGPPAPPDPERDRKRTGHHVEPDGQTAATVHAPVKIDNELYVRDYSKCILCYKCVDACGEQYQNTFAIHVAGRGFDARISTEYVAELPESACVYCGNCIAVCPTGRADVPLRARAARGGRLARGRPGRDPDRSARTAASAATSSCTCRTTGSSR